MSTDSHTARAPSGPFTPAPPMTVTLTAWRDQIIEQHPESHPTASDDTLTWWTPILGPTAVLMAHRFASLIEEGGERTLTDLDIARTFGMGNSRNRLRSCFARLERFGVAALNGPTFAVRLVLPPLTSRQLDQLPTYLVERYEHRRHELRAAARNGPHRRR